ncbi:MAG: hypothetical protein IJV35_05250 [Neisseriaceae bacterium]|nr:hypothetical protein [Neisseriaceae bacterium]
MQLCHIYPNSKTLSGCLKSLNPFSLRAEIATPCLVALTPTLDARGDTVVSGETANNCLSARNDGKGFQAT